MTNPFLFPKALFFYFFFNKKHRWDRACGAHACHNIYQTGCINSICWIRLLFVYPNHKRFCCLYSFISFITKFLCRGYLDSEELQVLPILHKTALVLCETLSNCYGRSTLHPSHISLLIMHVLRSWSCFHSHLECGETVRTMSNFTHPLCADVHSCDSSCIRNK